MRIAIVDASTAAARRYRNELRAPDPIGDHRTQKVISRAPSIHAAKKCPEFIRPPHDRDAMTRFYRLARTRWSDVGLVTLVLVGGSLLPSPFRRRPAFEGFGPDTVLHFLGYAGFGVALADALGGEGVGPVRSGLLTVCSSAAIAVGTGRLQRYIPGRAHERSDVVAGVAGACVGVLWWISTPATRQDSSPQSSADPEEENFQPERDRANAPI